MAQFIIILALLGISGFSYVQDHQLDKLHVAVGSLDVRRVQLKAKLAQKHDLVAALYKYTASNHKNIRRLKRKRVLDVDVFGPEMEVAHGPERPLSRSLVGVTTDLYDVGWTRGRKVYIKNQGIFTIGAVLPDHLSQKLHLYTPSGAGALRLGGKALNVYLLDVEPSLRRVASAD